MATGAAEDEGLRIILTPLQLASVFENETLVEGGTVANRLIGALRLLGCGVEMTAGGALLLAPEPTMVTKAAGGTLVLHGADQCVTGGRQVWTGRDERSFTERGASAVARELGAGRRTAQTVGTVVDIAVPVGAALLAGAARAASIRAGRISLTRHEAAAGARIGGHTVARHVGLTEAQLRARIAATAGLRRPPPAISSFDDLATAERAVSRALQSHRTAIQSWATSARPGATKAWQYASRRQVGSGVVRATGTLQRMNKVRVVLKVERYNGMPYYVLTSFPVP
jgi:hypothetical protein